MGHLLLKVKESHGYLSVKLFETAEDKLSHKKESCGKEIINAFFEGYCVSCALARGDHARAQYLHPKKTILSKLWELLGEEDVGLAELKKLGQKLQGMP